MFVLARHGDAGKKKGWDGPDVDRPLSPVGHQQAIGLARNLGMLQSPRLISSPFVRCHQTLQPMAKRRGGVIRTDPRLGPDSPASELDPLLSDDAFANTVLCTHGETIMEILARWKQLDLVSVPIRRSQISKDATAKGGAWIFIDEGEGWTAHYLTPLHVGPPLAED